MVLDGALARESFDAYIEQLLLPTLVPGQIVVLDNLPVHKSARARALIEGGGCSVLFLPAYSPDFNPIELAFAKIKQALRGKAERTITGIVAATGPALDDALGRTPSECNLAPLAPPFGASARRKRIELPELPELPGNQASGKNRAASAGEPI
ncbi:MAG: family transposase [Thermomicrobiales bacterium]|nr:family transposase [Thermomicrobiales bacterium]